MPKKKKSVGRPEKPESERKSERLVVRFTPDEKEMLRVKAGEKSLSDWARETLLS